MQLRLLTVFLRVFIAVGRSINHLDSVDATTLGKFRNWALKLTVREHVYFCRLFWSETKLIASASHWKDEVETLLPDTWIQIFYNQTEQYFFKVTFTRSQAFLNHIPFLCNISVTSWPTVATCILVSLNSSFENWGLLAGHTNAI